MKKTAILWLIITFVFSCNTSNHKDNLIKTDLELKSLNGRIKSRQIKKANGDNTIEYFSKTGFYDSILTDEAKAIYTYGNDNRIQTVKYFPRDSVSDTTVQKFFWLNQQLTKIEKYSNDSLSMVFEKEYYDNDSIKSEITRNTTGTIVVKSDYTYSPNHTSVVMIRTRSDPNEKDQTFYGDYYYTEDKYTIKISSSYPHAAPHRTTYYLNDDGLPDLMVTKNAKNIKNEIQLQYEFDAYDNVSIIRNIDGDSTIKTDSIFYEYYE